MRGKVARCALVVIVISSENNDPVPLPANIPSRWITRRHRPASAMVGVLWKKIQLRVFSFESGEGCPFGTGVAASAPQNFDRHM